MEGYLETYGAGEERRGRIIKRVVLACVGLLLIALASYFILHNWPERQAAKSFLTKVNGHDYRAAYTQWGCTNQSPCPNYDFGRFMSDWAPKNTTGPWSIASTDSCSTFLTINLQAPGSELQSLAVQRSDRSLGFAPAPECQEPQWHWKQFFQRLTGKTPPPPPPPAR